MSGITRAGFAAAGLVVIGAVFGVLGTHVWLAHAMHAPTTERTHEEAFFDMLGSLSLTDGQRHAVDAVLDRYHAKLEGHLAPVHPVLAATMDSARREIETLLDTEQLAAFHDWISVEHERLESGSTPIIHH